MLEQFIPLLNNFSELQTASFVTNYCSFPESNEYNACSFSIDNYKIIYREAKVTPKKTGLFVAIWKRNEQGITEPYHIADDFDFMIISCVENNNKGYFIFPKEALATLNIISSANKEGKRGMRVYPTWDIPTNKQAITTQKKHKDFFTIL